jgi:hypothetical protein
MITGAGKAGNVGIAPRGGDSTRVTSEPVPELMSRAPAPDSLFFPIPFASARDAPCVSLRPWLTTRLTITNTVVNGEYQKDAARTPLITESVNNRLSLSLSLSLLLLTNYYLLTTGGGVL